MAKDKNLISAPEVPYYSRKFKCTTLAVRIAKGIVGHSTYSVEKYIEELRSACFVGSDNGAKTIEIQVPINLLFNDEYLEG